MLQCIFFENLSSITVVFNDQKSTFALDANSTLTLTSWGMIGVSGTFKKMDGTVLKPDKPGQLRELYFANGIYSNNGADILLTAPFDIAQTASIRLGKTEYGYYPAGYFKAMTLNPISDKVYVTNNNYVVSNPVRIEGTPVFRNPNSIILANQNCFATLAIDNALNQNIVLNGGLITLEGPLSLTDDVKLTGSGRINMNQYK